jgi:hypothetical protein
VAELREQPAPRNPEAIDRIAEIEQLAALDPVDYEATRGEAAERLNLRVLFLDRQVVRKRRALGLTTDDGNGQGRAIKIADPLPWHESVGGDHVASALAAAVKVYAVLPDMAADAIALWILHTWVVDSFNISPRLAITSPTKGCGKTTVLRLLNKLARRPKRAGSISPPALFRVIEMFQPTILLDETEKYVEHGSDLHGLLNEGHCKGGNVLRVLGEKQELREFGVYGPVAFARNGKLPDDLKQRSIVVEMKRRLPDEPVSELRDDRCASLDRIARKCARWADDNAALLVDRDPDMGGLINRAADNWRPLFAIADVIGFDWPERIRQAALALAPRDSEGTGPMLLADIKAAFDDKTTDRLSSVETCETLAAMEGRPWAEWNVGKPITPNQLARLLKLFEIIPNSVRVGGKTPKGYYRQQFEEAWRRYLTPRGVPEAQQRNNPDEIRTFAASQSATPRPNVAVQKYEKPPSNGHCCGVAVQNRDSPCA